MEKGGGTTMSAGAPVSVGRQGPSIGAEVSPQVTQIESSQGEVNEAVSIPEQDSGMQVGTAENNGIQDSIGRADELLEVAKKDGVDAAFEELASEEANENEPVDNESNIPSDRFQEEAHSPKEQFNENTLDKESMIVEPRLLQLEEKVDKLIEENEDLTRRVERAEEVAKLTLESLMLLQELAKQQSEENEEEEKKKQGLFALLTALITKMMIAMMAGPDEASKAKIDTKVKGGSSKVHSKLPELEEDKSIPKAEKVPAQAA